MKALVPVLVVFGGTAIDLVTKAWARHALEPYGPANDFLPFLSLRLTFNEGISFSLFSGGADTGRVALLLVTGLMSLLIALWAWRAAGRERLALCVILGGALANLIDRAWFGAVTDFLDLHFGDWHPFVFNLADVWISLGVVFLFAATLWDSRVRQVTDHGQVPD